VLCWQYKRVPTRRARGMFSSGYRLRGWIEDRNDFCAYAGVIWCDTRRLIHRDPPLSVLPAMIPYPGPWTFLGCQRISRTAEIPYPTRLAVPLHPQGKVGQPCLSLVAGRKEADSSVSSVPERPRRDLCADRGGSPGQPPSIVGLEDDLVTD
jgi:hypothetical protein